MSVSDELKAYLKSVRVEHDRRIDNIYLRKTDFSQGGGLSLADLSNYVTKDEFNAFILSGGGSSITYGALDITYIFADNVLDANYLASSDALDLNYIFGTT